VALGARMTEAGLPSWWHEAALVAVFSLAAPLGVAIGVGVTTSLNTSGMSFLLIQGTFDGVCAGLLLYLGFVLLLLDFPRDVREYVTGKAGAAMRMAALFSSLWLGAGLMAAIGKWL
jgi:zinc transporter 1/2/3